MVIQPIHDISQVCALKGVKHAILSPGSRCAPLTLSFTRNPTIQCWTVSDERSAAFQAIGMYMASKSPTVLVCTSGSAAYNYAPAVAEAFYQQIPLIVLTADRPTEWIDQLDGQTIRQNNIYGNHVKKSYQLPDQYEAKETSWHINRILNEAINISTDFPQGPVHINVPLREPFYPEKDEILNYSADIRIIESANTFGFSASSEVIDSFNKASRILLVPGQTFYSKELIKVIAQFKDQHHVALASDVISNLQEIPGASKHQDIFLGNPDHPVIETLKPDLLITFGKSIISKNLKLFLRNYPAPQHWHIQPSIEVADTFQQVNHVFKTSPEVFFTELSKMDLPSDDFTIQKRKNYQQNWQTIDEKTSNAIETSLQNTPFSEMHAVNLCMEHLPKNSNLHLANSMAVRYANFLGIKNHPTRVFSNRGTSGIDGSNSTSYGHALLTDELVTLITGDLAFFYDRNAFWNNYRPKNLRVIVINNHGGGIFKIIKGPSAVKELEEFFVTDQALNCEHLCAEYDFMHYLVQNDSELSKVLATFYHKSEKPKVLEIKTNADLNQQTLKTIKESV